jgi:putative transcriptional regulator
LQASRLGIKMDSLEFSDSVKELRKQLNLSQEELARKLDISFSTISRWENGKSSPSKLAKKQLDTFVAKMKKQGRLNLPKGTA